MAIVHQSINQNNRLIGMTDDRLYPYFRFFTTRCACAVVDIRPPTTRYQISIRIARNHYARMRRWSGNRVPFRVPPTVGAFGPRIDLRGTA